MQPVWTDLTYLLRGTQRQQDVYRALQTLDVFRVLRDYTPILVGTIPLDVDIEQSDLDIICEAHNLSYFQHDVIKAFGRQAHFQVRETGKDDLPAVVASFTAAGFPIEIFGQPRPVIDQNGYRHMVVEARLLALGGEEVRLRIRELKRAGLKTEPAFARYFQLAGDPYQALLHLAQLSDDELATTVARGLPPRD
jgi:Domain of unknown function (DUF4269)